MKAAMITLSEIWPRAIPFNDLLAEARRLCGRSSQNEEELLTDVRVLAASLLRAYAGTLVEFHVLPPRCVTRPSEHPIVSPLARVQAREGKRVTNFRHATIAVEGPLERQLLQLLDGSRDRAVLLNDLSRLVEMRILTVQKGGEPVTDLETARQILATELEDKLVEIGKNALFVS